MTITDLKTKRAQARAEYDKVHWRKVRYDERLDALAKEIDDLNIEIGVAEMARDYVEKGEVV